MEEILEGLKGKLLFSISDVGNAPPVIFSINEDVSGNFETRELKMTSDNYLILKTFNNQLTVKCNLIETNLKSRLVEYNDLLNNGFRPVEFGEPEEVRLHFLHKHISPFYPNGIPTQVRIKKPDEELLHDLESQGATKYLRKSDIPEGPSFDIHRQYFTIYNRYHKNKSLSTKDPLVPKRAYTKRKGRNVLIPNPVPESQPGFILEIVNPDPDVYKHEPDQDEEDTIFKLLSDYARISNTLAPTDWAYINPIYDRLNKPGLTLTDSEKRILKDIIEIYQLCNHGPFYKR